MNKSNTFYLIVDLKNETVNRTIGEVSFGNFFADEGYYLITYWIRKESGVLNFLKIKDQYNKEYTIEEFLESIKTLNILEN